MYRWLSVLVLIVFCCGAAAAAEEEIYTIETEGIATVDIAPTYVEFWLHRHAKGETLSVAVNAATQLEPGLRKELQDHELIPSDLFFTGVAVPDIEGKEADISARIRFKATFKSPEEGPKEFAALCDKILDIAKALECQPKGPTLGVDDANSVQETAIKRAIEKAYPSAEAAAAIMSAQIFTVWKVNIEGVDWNAAPDAASTQPEINRLTCTAKVRVTYMFNRA